MIVYLYNYKCSSKNRGRGYKCMCIGIIMHILYTPLENYTQNREKMYYFVRFLHRKDQNIVKMKWNNG